ncbi:oxidoreductase [Clostridium acetobutylicum]|nr:oxidoreductase [Clostridium acetobutylicum]
MINTNTKIGFIGTGVMGKGMIKNLLKGGYTVHVYNRTKEKALPLVEIGVVLETSIKELSQKCDVIITMVGYPSDVEEVYFNDNGILNNLKPQNYVVDMTTSKPSLAKKIYAAAKERNIFALDAPVSGGDIGASEGTLSIMVGGDKEVFDALMPIFELMGKNIVLQGSAGSGQHTKMCNQIAIASNIMGVCEALSYAKKSGLNAETVLKSIGAGGAASWQLSAYAPRILKGDFNPGFYIKHFVKDMKIALEEADEMGLKTPALELSKKLYDKLIKEGKEDLGTQALYHLYNED